MAQRKPKPATELIEDSIPQDAKSVKPTKKVVETKTITYDAPAEEVEELEIEDDESFDLEEKPKRKRNTLKEVKMKLRERWAKKGISPSGNLRISLFKFTNDDDPMSGASADKAYCTKFQTTEEAIDAGIHLEAASKFGPGRYWIIIYLNNQIADQWEFRVAGSAMPVSQIPNGQPVTSFDQSGQPQFTIQMPNQQQPSPVDPMKVLRESFKIIKEFKEAMGVESINPPSQPQPKVSEEMQLASFALQDPDIKKKVLKNLFGSNGDGEKDTLELILNNVEPIGRALQGLVDRVFMNINQMRGDNNGQAAMAPTALQTEQIPDMQQPDGQIFARQGQSQSNEDISQGTRNGISQPTQFSQDQARQSPEDALLNFVLDQCVRKVPVKIAADRIIKMADAINEHSPAQSIDGYLELFVSVTPEAVLEYVKTSVPNGEQITAMEHSLEWTDELQKALGMFFAQDGGEDEPS